MALLQTRRHLTLALAGSTLAAALWAASPLAMAAEPGVFFVEPANGAVVGGPFKVVFGVRGMEVRPAGEAVQGTGHHHLLIGIAGVPSGDVIPVDAQHLHFGKGQTETELTLAPGQYRLTLQFADGQHVSYGPRLAAHINITVKP